MADTATPAVTLKNTHEIMGRLAHDVRAELLDFGLISASDNTPALMLVHRVLEQEADIKTRILFEIRNMAFYVACSEPKQLLWERVWYQVGTNPTSTTLPVVIKLLDMMTSENRARLGVNAYGNEAGFKQAPPMVVHFSAFAQRRDDQGNVLEFWNGRTNIRDTYDFKALDKFYDKRRRRLSPARPQGSIDQILSPNNPHARPDDIVRAHAARPNKHAMEGTGNVTAGFQPQQQATMPPAAVQQVLSPEGVQGLNPPASMPAPTSTQPPEGMPVPGELPPPPPPPPE
jgi:hypothetical protein